MRLYTRYAQLKPRKRIPLMQLLLIVLLVLLLCGALPTGGYGLGYGVHGGIGLLLLILVIVLLVGH